MSPIKAFNFKSWRVKNEILKAEAANRNDSVSIASAVLYFFMFKENIKKFSFNLVSSTHREILLNQTEIGLYLPFSDCFATANGRFPFVVSN